MQEENVKKREWVKSAAIIFLSILLVLTFFSNTIMNISLPEVATVMAMSDKINNQVRIQGTVSAKESYDVVADQTRTVESVLVRIGDEVNVGDVLIKVAKGESSELQELRLQLKELELSYEEAKLNATDTDYTKAQNEIAKAKTALNKAMTTLAECKEVSSKDLASAKLAVADAQKAIDAAEDAIDAAQTGIEKTSEGVAAGTVDEKKYNSKIKEAEQALLKAESNASSASIKYGAIYNTLLNETKIVIEFDIVSSGGTTSDAIIADNLDYYLEKATAGDGTATKDQKDAYEAIHSAEIEVKNAKDDLDKANQDLIDAQKQAASSYVAAKLYNGKTRAYYETELATAQGKLKAAQKTYTEKTTALSELQTQSSEYETAYANFEASQENYGALVEALADRMKSDNINVQHDQINLERIQMQISDMKQQISKLASTSGTDIVSKVSGTVQSIYASAGHTISQGDILMNIEVGDVGFTMTSTVTIEQAKLLKEGDAASVSNYWYGTEGIATIATIKPNPQNPRTEKIVTFDITGDVYAGMSMSFSIGGKSQYYDTVIPLSALRSDSNGQFVYVVTVKSSPLGNRYTAKRTDVKVLAQDDTNVAVSGLSYGDYVITTSGKPIESGSLVKLVDE